MIFIQSLSAGSDFSEAIELCTKLARTQFCTVVLRFNGSVIIFNHNDSEFINSLYDFYDNQRKENSAKKMIEIGRLLSN
jgi:hypothetical protein